MDPEGRSPAELGHTAVAPAVALGDLRDGCVHRGEHGGIGIVDAEPEDPADGVGEPAAHLGDQDEARLLGGDGTLVEVLPAFTLEGHGAPAVRDLISASPGVIGHREVGAFVVIAHALTDVG